MRGFSALFSGCATGKRRLARCLKSADWKSRALAGSASSHHHLQERKTPSTRAAASSPRLKRRHLRSCESPPWHTAVIRTTQVEQGLSCISSRQNREPQVGATARAPRSGSGSVCRREPLRRLCPEDAQGVPRAPRREDPRRSRTKKPVPETEKARARAPDPRQKGAAWINPECVS
jgi:hypothetical protein